MRLPNESAYPEEIDQLYWDDTGFNLNVSKSYDFDEPADFETHWENAIGKLSVESLDESTALHMEYPTGPNEQKNGPSGSLVSAEKALGASTNNNASINADNISDSEPTAINTDDTTLQKSCASLH
ncbi:hypothetical protein PILCRDRAFT_16978 [Piloderma croceum F 1598]|uniref:Uncharacterized protein n=1 Tax=Piloderma croceum (strain F 1598) TaxID=765440 RepID=A0A0C3B2Q5_PILCF|nr:hypothetical protein PILCRDRAFT_16978 [Piloderma croceum F 1598]